jgi:hypothetical protein
MVSFLLSLPILRSNQFLIRVPQPPERIATSAFAATDQGNVAGIEGGLRKAVGVLKNGKTWP